MDDANARALLARVPDVLGNLEAVKHGAVGALVFGLAPVHVPNDTRPIIDTHELVLRYMYLCNFNRYPGPAIALIFGTTIV